MTKRFLDSEDILTCSAYDWYLTNNANPEDYRLTGLHAYCDSGNPSIALLNKLKNKHSDLDVVAIVGYMPHVRYPAATLIVKNRQNKTLIKPSEIEKKVEQSFPLESTDGQFHKEEQLVHSEGMVDDFFDD